MPYEIVAEYFGGIVVLKPSVFHDERGYFLESFQEQEFRRLGLPTVFRQDNHSRSHQGVLRGLHFQWDEPMGKLLRVSRGEITLTELDIRHKSPTLRQHISFSVSDVNNHIVWIPPGFANGFLVTSDFADVHYKCTALHNAHAEGAIRWNSCGIDWGIEHPVMSQKDAKAESLEQWLEKDESRNFSL